METMTIRSIEMEWHPDSRLAVLRFHEPTDATGDDAVALVAAIRRWVGEADAPFGLLGDGSRLSSVDAEYRATWSRFLRQHRDRCCLAFFNMGPFIRIAAEMFRIGSGLNVKAFAGEEDARAWLRGLGVAA